MECLGDHVRLHKAAAQMRKRSEETAHVYQLWKVSQPDVTLREKRNLNRTGCWRRAGRLQGGVHSGSTRYTEELRYSTRYYNLYLTTHSNKVGQFSDFGLQ
ncbi:hypothetical protein PFLUV_G00050240 [Perca fluviatilis]|uniref:Uncharacterized protein n=1 Tax=Perca fluviatilis TaxID=8168 RepID=A0A6A5FPW4_PERFL|nr:hypothetical protein PFLUV_G00050240 [Perca fluviatilis]